MCRVCSKKRGVSRVVRWGLSMKILKVWMYALGSYSDDKTKPYDKYMVLVRSAWVLLHITTCLFIIIGNGRILELW